MKTTLFFVIFVFCCGLLPEHSSAMDANASVMPAGNSEYSVDLSQLTTEEREWYVLFHEGAFLTDGWREITAKILAQTPNALQAEQRQTLDQLGNRIALEWCKNNSERKVDNKMLQQWGGELKQAVKKNPEQLPDIIASISREVDLILD